MNGTQIRVLLADEQSHVRSALQVVLENELGVNVVGEANNVDSLLSQVQTSHPDVVLLDWELPGPPAAGYLSTLHGVQPKLAVVALGLWPEMRREALTVGADAFVSKVDPPEHLLTIMRDLDTKRKEPNYNGLVSGINDIQT